MECIRTNFVPVALNLYVIRDAEGAAGDFFRSIVKQKPQYQGLWVVTPEGKVLIGHQDTDNISDWQGEWPRRVLADLRAGLAAFGPVAPRELPRDASDFYELSLPHRGRGKQEDGSVQLAVCQRFVVVQDLDQDPPADAVGSTVLDSIQLSDESWSALLPPSIETGAQWSVPEATAREFYRILSTGDTTFRNAEEVTGVQINGRVQQVDGQRAYLEFLGSIAGTHHGTANEGKQGNQCSATAELIGGIGVYDTTTRQMISLTLVFDGLWRNYAPYDDPPTRFGAVVQWQDN